MLSKQEIAFIKNRFERYIKEGKIKKPKATKKEFFKNKAETSINLAKELLEKEDYLDWVICIAYYSMFYNAISILAHNHVDLEDINESTHTLIYTALVYFFYIKTNKIELHYLDEFKNSMAESDIRLKNLAKKKTEEILSNYKNAKEERRIITYELGITAKIESAETAIRRAEAFDILTHRLTSG